MSKQKKNWSATIEETHPPLHVYERVDRDGQLYLRWADGKSHRRPKLKGLDSVRKADGTLDPKLVTRARSLALEQYDAARTRQGEPADSGRTTEPLTLLRGFAEVLAVPGGKYSSANRAPWKVMRRARDRVLSILPPEKLWRDLWPKEFSVVWRTMADRYASGASDLDWRAAEETVQTFLAASNWLGGAGGFLPAAPQPPKRWRAALKEDWLNVTDERPEANRPRHDSEEIDRIWAAVHLADPRLQLWMELGGGEYRGGQVLRGNRSDLDLTPGAGDGHGTFVIHGRGRKRGETVFLTPEQRAAVDYALGEGFLSDLEAEFQAGERNDYPLWPGGKLRKGKAVDRGTRMNRTTMLGYFKKLEALAKVEHVDGRGWYGVRRGSADRARKHTTDERVKNALGGWAPGSTVRPDVYEDGSDPEVLREAARTRRLARGTAQDEDANPSISQEEAVEMLRAMGVPPEKVQAALTLLGLKAA